MQSGHPYGDTNNNNNHNNTAPSYPMSSQAGPVSMPISSPSASSSSSTAAAGHNGSASLNQIHRLTASASPISRPPLNPFTNHANHHQMMQQQKQQRDHRMQMQHVQQQQQQVQQQNHMQTAHSDQPYCCKCNRLITDRHLLRALEQYW